jgi:hypothetical protein
MDLKIWVEFTEQRLRWLKEILELPNGIPSDDIFYGVLQRIDPEQIGVCLS